MRDDSSPEPSNVIERTSIKLSHAETKRALAIFAHLKQIMRTATEGGRLKRPVEMDQAELVLASASIRALFFDDTPQLITFLNQHELHFQIEAMESNLGLILLSELLPEPGHVSDELVACLYDPEKREQFPLDKPSAVVIVHESRHGLESMLDGHALWAPTREEDIAINSSLSAFTNVGPMQLLELCRRSVDIRDWGSLRVGYLKSLRIDRRNLITYVANKLGGVHYDSKRRPAKLEDADQFRALATSYDWDDQSLMHAGLVATGVACSELVLVPELRQLYEELGRLLASRQRSLIKMGEQALSARGC